MSLTTDKLKSLVKKWHTLIEAWVDIKTTDGYILRMFCIGFTKRRLNQSASRKPATPSLVKSAKSERRWSKSCNAKPLLATSTNSSPNSSLKLSVKKCKRPPKES